MALELNTEVGAELANSYADLTYADDYWANHFNSLKSSQWTALSDEAKAQLLIQACMVIDMARFTEPTDFYTNSHLEWDYARQQFRSVKGYIERPQRYNYYQALQFPRTDTVLTDGSPIIPERIKAAQCEQALYLLNFDETALATAMQGVRGESVSLGSVATSQTFSAVGTLYSPIAKSFVSPYLLKTSTRLGRA